MGIRRHIALPAVLLAVAGLTWWVVNRGPEPAGWLHVEIPEQAVIGERFPVTVVLHVTRANELVRADLHWKDSRYDSRGLLSTAPAQLTGARERAYTFDLSVPARDAMAYVYGVIYVSPTGRWTERTRVCTFEPIRVTGKSEPGRTQKRRRVAAFDLTFQPTSKRSDSGVIRWTTATLLLVAGFICARLRRSGGVNGSSQADDDRVRWGWLALACLVAAIWEATTAESFLGDMLRKFAVHYGLYSKRRFFQQLLTTAAVVVSASVAAAALRRARVQPASWLFCTADVYWGISAVSFISLHDVDALLATPVLTIPVVQIVKLVLALTAVAATGGALRAAAAARP